jgi:hydroxyacylglutathione hydrolase
MQQIAPDLYLLNGFPKNAINIYLMEQVLVDAGTRYASRRILSQLRGHQIAAHAITHAHPDHQGSSRYVCQALNIPLWCGEKDVTATESGNLCASGVIPTNIVTRLQDTFLAGPGHPVTRQLHEGDHVGSFEVIETPGHSPGHISFWREKDRVLILGDVLLNMNFFTGKVGLEEPPLVFTVDSNLNRDSARKVAQLNPTLVCFGHGPPLRDTDEFVEFVSLLA